MVSLNLDVEKRCPRDAAVRVIGVDGDGPELGDALRGKIMFRGDQGDEGCESHEGRAETGEERGHRLRKFDARGCRFSAAGSSAGLKSCRAPRATAARNNYSDC